MPPPTDAEALAPPDPAGLEESRQAIVRERFAVRTLTAVLVVALYVNLTGGLIGGIMLGWSIPTVLAGTGVAAGLPLLGAIGVNWWHRRDIRRVREELDPLLGVKPGSRLLQLLVFGLAGLGGFAVYSSFDSGDKYTGGLVFIVMGVLLPFIRRIQDRHTPFWALAVMGGWMAMAGLLAIGLAHWVDPDVAMLVAVVLLFAAPFSVPAFVLRNWIRDSAARDDALGRVARVWAVFLPPAQVAAVARVSGDAAGALDLLINRMKVVRRRPQLVEALSEAGEALLEMEDERALPVLCGAALIGPGAVEPFVGLARWLRDTDSERARAYLDFAEANAARTVGGGSEALAALRGELDR